MNKPITLLIFFMLAVQLTQAQVGINTMDPRPSAALDICTLLNANAGIGVLLT